MKTIELETSKKEHLSALLALGANMDYATEVINNLDTFETFGLTNAHRWAVFLGQCSHESAGFCVFEENLYYRAESLMRTWPSRYNTLEKAKSHERNPELIANYVYGGRMGNDAHGDGYLYRGRGPIQLTGKNNYARASDFLKMDLVSQPSLVETDVTIGLLTALWFFAKHSISGKSLLKWADELSYRMTTKRINGGFNGLADRTFRIREALAIYATDEGITKRPLIRRGSTGREVKELQHYLKSLGFMRTINGKFGPATEKAVMEFQKKAGLRVDGIVGNATFGQLQTAVFTLIN